MNVAMPYKTPSGSSDSPSRSGRIHFMDEVRGFDLLLMIAFHSFYTIGWLFRVPAGQTLFLFFQPVEPFFAGVFIFICGISCRLSHNNWLRGGVLLGIAVGMSVFLWVFMRDEMIWFGILHFLAVSILLFALCRPLLDRIPLSAGLIACALLLLITWWLPYNRASFFGIPGLFGWQLPSSIVSNPWLYPLGLGQLKGADYFPLFPWLFCFLAGTFVGRLAAAHRFPRWMYKSRVPWLSWLGRHTLIIYVVHQPVIFALCWLITTLL